MSELSLDARLVAMGEALEFPRAGSLADDVVAALERPAAPVHRWRRPLLAVAAVTLLVLAVTVAIPDSRRAVARWFGFDGYRIERVVDFPDVDAGPAPIGPLVTRGDLTTDAFFKLTRMGTEVREVDVNGHAGYWISGGEHLFFTYDRNGVRQEQRLAGNTLVWQQGNEIVRIEGVDLTLDEALEIAADVG
jgi:hypothetical protein